MDYSSIPTPTSRCRTCVRHWHGFMVKLATKAMHNTMMDLDGNIICFESRFIRLGHYRTFTSRMIQSLVRIGNFLLREWRTGSGRGFMVGGMLLVLSCSFLVNVEASSRLRSKRSVYLTLGRHSQGCRVPIRVLGYRVRNRAYEYEIANLVIKNCSPKPIKEALFSWEIVSFENGQLIERKGMDFTRIFPNTLRPGETIRLPFVVATIPKLLIGESSESRWRLGVVLSNATFSDGTNWKPNPAIRPL